MFWHVCIFFKRGSVCAHPNFPEGHAPSKGGPLSHLYVKVQCTFYNHRKTMRLKAALGDDAFWIPPRLWAFAAQNQPDGIFKDYSPEEIATAIGYTRNASSMLQALLKAGFMDSDPLQIHDWSEHNGYHLTYADRARKAAAARWKKTDNSPSAPSPINRDIDIEREPSIASSNALSIPPLSDSRKISLEKELERIGKELSGYSKQSEYAPGTTKFKRIGELTARQNEIRKLLGVVA